MRHRRNQSSGGKPPPQRGAPKLAGTPDGVPASSDRHLLGRYRTRATPLGRQGRSVESSTSLTEGQPEAHFSECCACRSWPRGWQPRGRAGFKPRRPTRSSSGNVHFLLTSSRAFWIRTFGEQSSYKRDRSTSTQLRVGRPSVAVAICVASSVFGCSGSLEVHSGFKIAAFF